MESEELKVLICGGRIEFEFNIVENSINSILEKYNFESIEIISGGCKGADKSGELFAETHGYPVKQFLPAWSKYGRAVGVIRNKEMIEYISDFPPNAIVIAFWDGESKGTKNTIEEAQKKNIPVYIYHYPKK